MEQGVTGKSAPVHCSEEAPTKNEDHPSTQHSMREQSSVDNNIRDSERRKDGEEGSTTTNTPNSAKGYTEVSEKQSETSRIQRAMNMALMRFPNILNSIKHSVGDSMSSPQGQSPGKLDVVTPATSSIVQSSLDDPLPQGLPAYSKISNGPEAVASSSHDEMHLNKSSETIATCMDDPSGEHMSNSRASSAAFSSFTSNPHSTAVSTHSSHSNLLSLTTSFYDMHHDVANYHPRAHYVDAHPLFSSVRRWGRHGPFTSASFHGAPANNRGLDHHSLARHASDSYLLRTNADHPLVYANAQVDSTGLPLRPGFSHEPYRHRLTIRRDFATDCSLCNWPSTDSSSPLFNDFSSDITVVQVSPRSDISESTPSPLNKTLSSVHVAGGRISSGKVRTSGQRSTWTDTKEPFDGASALYSAVLDGYYSSSSSTDARSDALSSPLIDITDTPSTTRTPSTHQTDGNSSPSRGYFLPDQTSLQQLPDCSKQNERPTENGTVASSSKHMHVGKGNTSVAMKKSTSREAKAHTNSTASSTKAHPSTAQLTRDQGKNSTVPSPTASGHAAVNVPSLGDGTYTRSYSMQQFQLHPRLGASDQAFSRSNTLPTIHVHSASREAPGTGTALRPVVPYLQPYTGGNQLFRALSVPRINHSPSPTGSTSGPQTLGDELKRFKYQGSLTTRGSMRDIHGRVHGQTLLERTRINRQRLALLKSKDFPSYLPITRMQSWSPQTEVQRHGMSVDASPRPQSTSRPAPSTQTPKILSNSRISASTPLRKSHSGFAEQLRRQVNTSADNVTVYPKSISNGTGRSGASVNKVKSAGTLKPHNHLTNQAYATKGKDRKEIVSVYQTYPNITTSRGSKATSPIDGREGSTSLPDRVERSTSAPKVNDLETSTESTATCGDVSDSSTVYSDLLFIGSTSSPSVEPDNVHTPEEIVSEWNFPKDEATTTSIPSESSPVPTPKSHTSRVMPPKLVNPIVTHSPMSGELHEDLSPSEPKDAKTTSPTSTSGETHPATIPPHVEGYPLPPASHTPPTRLGNSSPFSTPTPDSTHTSTSSQSRTSSIHSGSHTSTGESNWSLSTSSSVRQRLSYSSNLTHVSAVSSSTSSSNPPTSTPDTTSRRTSLSSLSLHTSTDHSNSSSQSNSLVGDKLLGHSHPPSRIQTPDSHTHSSDVSSRERRLSGPLVTPDGTTSTSETNANASEDEEVTEKPILTEATMFAIGNVRKQEMEVGFDSIDEGQVQNDGISGSMSPHPLQSSTTPELIQRQHMNTTDPSHSHPSTTVSSSGPRTSYAMSVPMSTSAPGSTSQVTALAGSPVSPSQGWRRERQDSLIASLLDPSIHFSPRVLFQESSDFTSASTATSKGSETAPSGASTRHTDTSVSVPRPADAIRETPHSSTPPHNEQNNSVKDDKDLRASSPPKTTTDGIRLETPLSTSHSPSSLDFPPVPGANTSPSRPRPRILTSPADPKNNGNTETLLSSLSHDTASGLLANDNSLLTPSWASTPLASSDSLTSFAETINVQRSSSIPAYDRSNSQTGKRISDLASTHTVKSNDAAGDGAVREGPKSRSPRIDPQPSLSRNLQTEVSAENPKESPIWMLSPSSEAGVQVTPSQSHANYTSGDHVESNSSVAFSEIIQSAIPSQSDTSPVTRRMSDGAKLSTVVYVQERSEPTKAAVSTPVQTLLDLVDTINYSRGNMQKGESDVQEEVDENDFTGTLPTLKVGTECHASATADTPQSTEEIQTFPIPEDVDTPQDQERSNDHSALTGDVQLKCGNTSTSSQDTNVSSENPSTWLKERRKSLLNRQRALPMAMTNALKAYGAVMDNNGVVTMPPTRSKQYVDKEYINAPRNSDHLRSTDSLSSRIGSISNQTASKRIVDRRQGDDENLASFNVDSSAMSEHLDADKSNSLPPNL